MYIPNVYRIALQCIYPMYIRMHYNVYACCTTMYIHNVYTDTLQCIHPISIVDIRWVTPAYTLGCTPLYIVLHFVSHNVYIFYVNMLPNVYTFVTQCIFNIHWVYTLGCIRIYIGLQDIYIVLRFLSHNVYTKKCYPMYIRQNALQCISPMYIKCNTMYIPPYTFHSSTKRGIYIGLHFIYIGLHFDIHLRCTLGCMVLGYIVVHFLYTLCNILIYIGYIHCVTFLPLYIHWVTYIHCGGTTMYIGVLHNVPIYIVYIHWGVFPTLGVYRCYYVFFA